MIRTDKIELRIFLLGGCLVAMGAVAAGIVFGFRQGASFFAGGLLAAANLAVLRHTINKALAVRTRSSGLRLVAGYGLRLLLIPLCLYAMMRFLFLGIIAATAGFTAFSCGVFLEGLFEAFRGNSK